MKKRVLLAGMPNQRNLDSLQSLIEGKDQRFRNGIIVPIKNPLSGKLTTYFEKRPGFEADAGLGACSGIVSPGCGGTAIYFSRTTGKTITAFCDSQIFVNCDAAGDSSVIGISGGEFAVFAGGNTWGTGVTSANEKYVFSSGSVTAASALTQARSYTCGAGNTIKGIAALGTTNNALNGSVSTTNIFNFSTETLTVGGNLSQTSNSGAGTGTSTIGVFAIGSTISDNAPSTKTAKYTYSSEVGGAGSTLATERRNMGAVGSTTHAFFSGGTNAAGSNLATTEKYRYSDDSRTSGTSIGTARSHLAGVCNTTVGIFAAGATTINVKITDKYTFSGETVTSGTDLASVISECSGASISSFGILNGGNAGSATGTHKYVFGADTVDTGGALSVNAYARSAISSNPGNL